MNIPFMPMRGLLGTDYMKVRPDFKAMPDPFAPGEEIAIVPAVAPDVAVFHGFVGDRFGNVLASGTTDAKLIVQASRCAVATVEELSDEDLTEVPHTGVLIPGIHVSAVVHAPGGAYPTSCRGYYGDDGDHIRAYMRAAASDETFRAYLERYVLGTHDHAEFLERAGASRVAGAEGAR